MKQTTETNLAEAAEQVLDAMFFVSVEAERFAEPREATLLVEVAFHGDIAGCFQVRLDDEFGRVLAANFQGSFAPEQVTSSVLGQVACELANMLCGATLSRLAPGTIFDLDPPRVGNPGKIPQEGAAQWIHTAEGSLHLHLHWGPGA